jgi:hypothetical protein
VSSQAAFYRPYFNESTGQIAMLSDEQFALLGPDSPWREIRPGDPLTPAEETPPDIAQKDQTWLS